jgi:hypothetical protein
MKRRIPVWAWFFIVLVVLSAIAATIEIWFNLSQQLTPEQVRAAQQLWRDKAPQEYTLDYLIRWQSPEPIRYQATVRNREVTKVTLDGQELAQVLFPLHDLVPLFDAVAGWLADDPTRSDGMVDYTAPATGSAEYRIEVQQGETVVTRKGQMLSAKVAAHYIPDAQFPALLRQLEIDHLPGAGRVFCVGTFHRQYGLLLRYVRSVSATRVRLEVGATRFESPVSP